jgi:hypothetical protein
MRCVLNRSSTRLGRRLKELTAVRRDRLLNRAQRIVHVPQLVLGRHALERVLDLAVAAQVFLAIDGMLDLLVERGLRTPHGPVVVPTRAYRLTWLFLTRCDTIARIPRLGGVFRDGSSDDR